MGFRYASWSLLLLLLLLLLHLPVMMYARGSGARETTEKQWNKKKDHHNPENNKQVKMQDPKGNIISGFPMDDGDDDVPNKGSNVLRLHSMDININDVHKATTGVHNLQHHAMDDHQSVHVKQDRDDDAHKGMHVHAHPSSHMDHIDPSVLVFFTMKDLKLGKKIAIYFAKRDPLTSPHLLSREEADSIPFSSQALPYLLQLFSFSPHSPQAKAMEETLRHCEIEPIKGETKFCPTSLESMVDFTRGVFGLDSQFKILSTTHLTKTNTLLQNYTILEVPKEISAPKIVACHSMPYPYAVFYCHSQESENKVFKVSLGGENGEKVEAVAVCHMDTSHWNHDHLSFRVLRVAPGSSPVCHFFPAENFVWVPLPTLN